MAEGCGGWLPAPYVLCPVAYGLGFVPAHCGEEAFAGLEQSVVCEVELPPINWALAVIDPAHNSAATRESILRSIFFR
jgi:hypothetical protein